MFARRTGPTAFTLAAGLALVAGLGSPARSAPEPRPVGAGFDVLSYDVRLRPDFAAKTVEGSTEIKLRVLGTGLGEIAFSDNALFLASVRVDGRPAAVTRGAGRLTIRLPRHLRAGQVVALRIAYRGAPKRGVSFEGRSVHTTYFACDWMICAQEALGDKAAVRLALTVPAGFTTLGPGALTARKRARTGEVVHHWRERRDYPAFTYAFAAGEFETAAQQAGPVQLAFVSGVAGPDELRRLFAPTADMLRFFETKAGVPFPHGRYAQLLVDGGAAQEAVSHAIIGRKVIDPILTQPEEDWVVAHELAHQWWGNLVTSRDLAHFWLNEGVTTFMVAAWKEQRWGRAAYNREMEIARRSLARARAAGVDVPLSHSGPYPNLGLRRAIQYSKGALFMDALRHELGDEAFWAGLQLFTRTHAGRSVESRDLQRAFERASGRDLQPLFEEWVF